MFLIKNLYNLSHNSYKFIKNINKINTKLLFNKNIENNKHLIIKCLSTNEKKSNEKNEQKLGKDLFDLPFLMNLTPKVVPNIFYTINNFFVVNFYLTPFVDKDFNLKTFLKGSKQALTVISSHLANDRIEQLEGLVTKGALEEITKNLSTFSPSQKQQLRVLLEDIIVCFAHNITIKRETNDKTTVKILVVYDCIQNIEELIKVDVTKRSFSMFDFEKYLDRKFCCNYEFTREYIKGMQSDWIVSKLLHIKDKDILKFHGLKNWFNK